MLLIHRSFISQHGYLSSSTSRCKMISRRHLDLKKSMIVGRLVSAYLMDSFLKWVDVSDARYLSLIHLMWCGLSSLVWLEGELREFDLYSQGGAACEPCGREGGRQVVYGDQEEKQGTVLFCTEHRGIRSKIGKMVGFLRLVRTRAIFFWFKTFRCRGALFHR